MKPGSSDAHPEPDCALANGFRDAMSPLAGTVAVITTGSGERRRRLTATAVAPSLTNAMVRFDCEGVEAVEAHTLAVFSGAVRAIHQGTDAAPLAHFGRRYRNMSLNWRGCEA